MRPLLSRGLGVSMLRFRILSNVTFWNERHGEEEAVVLIVLRWVVHPDNLFPLLHCLILHVDAAAFVHNRFRFYCAYYVKVPELP